MKRRDLERHLRSHGCREIGGSKHAKWRGPQGQVSALPRHKEIGQTVLVDQGLPGEITAVKRGTVPGVLGLPPLDTWLYAVKPEAGGDQQTDVPEYNLVAQADQDESPA